MERPQSPFLLAPREGQTQAFAVPNKAYYRARMSWPRASAFSVLIFAVAWLLAHQQTLAASVEPHVVAQLTHTSSISAIALTPDGRLIVSASFDRTIKLWDVATGALLRSFAGHEGEIWAVAVTPDGRRIVSGGGDDAIKVWDMATGALLRSIASGQGGVVASLAVTPDSRHVIAGGYGGAIGLWDLETGALIRRFEDHPGAVLALAVKPDGRQVISGGHGSSLKLWDLATGKLVRSFGNWFVGHNGWINSVAVTPDGSGLVSAGQDDVVMLWDLATGARLRVFEGHQHDVNAVAVTPDGRSIVSEDEQVINVWDLATGALLRSAGGQYSARSIAILPDNRYIVSAGKTVELLGLAKDTPARSFAGHQDVINAVMMTPDGRQVVSGGADGSVRVWDIASGTAVRRIEAHQEAVNSLAMTSDGRQILSASADDSIKLWDLATGMLVRSFAGHQWDVNTVAVARDGRRMASGSGDGTIKVWNMATGALLLSIESHQGVIISIAVTPDGGRIISQNFLGIIALWDIETGTLLRQWKSEGRAMALMPDGRQIVSAGPSATLRLWDLETGALLRSFAGREEGVRHWVDAVAVTPDGRQVVSASADSIRLWDLATGAEVKRFANGNGPVKAVAPSPDGRFLISAGDGGVIGIWDMERSRALASFVGGSDGGALAVTPQGFFAMDGEGKGASYLKVVDRLNVYDVRQFYQALYRPELVSELLQGDPEGKYEIAAGELNLRRILDSGPAPRLLLKRSERVGDSLKMTVEIEDQGGGIGKLEWRVDDVLLDGERGATPFEDGASFVADTRSFPLTAAGHVITVTAYNKAGLITAVPVVEKIDGGGIAENEKSRLFILAVGVNDYAQKSLHLNYAVNDATAFSARLRTAAEQLGLFKEVSVTTLLDGEVTRERLDRAFTGLAGRMELTDKFVFFAAGHGKVYKDRYYFYPQDLRFGSGDAITSQGIDQDTWQSWFSRVPALASVLIYDTCEAGQLTTAMRGSESIRTAIDLLKNATGRSILAATTAEDAAREGVEDHGVFTYALLRALSEGDSNEDGRIEVIELGQYVERTVPELTEERWGIAQRPRFTIQANFPLGSRLAPDAAGVAFIPKAPTHVIIRPVTLAVADRGASADKNVLPPGTTVRLLKSEGERALVARDGQELGFVPADALAPLN